MFGYTTEQLIDFVIKSLLMWLIIIPVFAWMRNIFPQLNIGILMAIGFFFAIILSLLISKWNINLGWRIKRNYDNFLNKINDRLWGKKQNG
jgi:hypothetical protein